MKESYFGKFFKHSFVYGIGNALNRGAAFLLLPLYTHTLLPGEYGALEMFYVIASVLGTLLGMNIAHGTLRFYFEFDNENDQKKVISTSLITTFVLCVFSFLLLDHFTQELSYLVFKSTEYRGLFRYVFVIVCMQLLNEIAFAYLRVKERSGTYVMLSAVQLVSQVLLNLYTVLILQWGVKGILLGNMLSIGITWLILMTTVLRYSGFSFDSGKLKLLLHYCLPFILSAFAGIIISNSDRVMLNTFVGLTAVGVYALGTKFGIVVRDLVMEPFFRNFGQSRFAIMKRPDAAHLYSRILTYFVLGVTIVSLGVTFFSREAMRIIASPEYLDAYKIVPIILMTVIFTGIGCILQTGILIHKKTKYVFYINLSSALLILLLNRIMIPHLHMYGAALANAFNSIFICILTYAISQSLLPIEYEFNRLTKLFLAATVYCLAAVFFPLQNLVAAVLLKSLMFLSFPFALVFMGFFRQEEKQKVREYLGKLQRMVSRGYAAVGRNPS